MSEAKRAALADIGSLTEAVALMIDGSGIARKEMAERLGVGAKHLNRMLNVNDPLHLDPELIDRAMAECKSALPLEWQALRRGYALHDLTLTSILEVIRDAMVKMGESPRFVVMAESGRVERSPA